ncbi:hypothetical protein F7725_023278 [Dissostichus mawsoni]|uniref:Uncharacterized protein n=1 Tax=Dissostichus mawsoni TaxID=36200 RepID=A0A7J5Z181_DISMA|nr:hypothetical protein F7725_023278 [Dissostichus mawsoni]
MFPGRRWWWIVQINNATGAAQLRKVVQFVCGNALVCDTIKEAKSVAFGGRERIKVHSRSGRDAVFKIRHDLWRLQRPRAKARVWDEKDMLRLKERKDQLMAEMRDLMKLKRKDSDLKEVVAQAQGAQTRLKYSKTDLDNIRKKDILKCQAEISRMESELANLDCQIQMQQESVETKDAEMRKIREQVHQMEDLGFSDFCAEIGVDNIRQYEQENLKHQTEIDNKRLEFDSQCTRLNAQMEYQQEQLEQQKNKLHKMEETIDKEERTMAEQRKEEELLVAVEESLSKHLEDLVKFQREVMSADLALEQKLLFRHNMLLCCKIQGLPIVLLSGNFNEISEVQLDTETESTSTMNTFSIYEREAQLIIDYSGLDENFRSLEAEKEVQAYIERLKESMSSIEGVLQRTTAPNLKALEKMREVKDKLQGEFELVKAKRLQLFTQCFDHVSLVIDQIYKRICRNNSAQAILSAETPEEPYLGHQLQLRGSGETLHVHGQPVGWREGHRCPRPVSAPAPFLILDEVDAALDNTNIGKIIVISLKEEFFSKSDALQGVYSDVRHFYSILQFLNSYSCMTILKFDECMFSHILTLDLQPYPLVEDENGK